MTFAAVTKILKVCTAAVILKGCSSATRRKKSFCEGYRFMQLCRQGDETIYSIQWKDVVVLLQNPVINQLNIR